MEKILDISGMLANFLGEYTDENCWIGRVILNENNRFEGVIEKLFSNDTYFIFGNMDSEHLDFIIGNNEDEEVPKRLVVYKDINCFEGSYSAKDIHTEIPMGDCRARIYPADQTREVSDYEMTILKNGINREKENFDERTKELYDAYKQELDGKVKKIGQK